MNILQQMKQQELYLGIVEDIVPDRSSEMLIASYLSESSTGEIRLMESILEWNNMKVALERVISNDGAPRVDGMKVNKLPGYFRRHWPKIRLSLLNGSYKPFPVKRVEIPKPDGGIRQLGVPTAIDRVVQQAIAQILSHIWDHTFSDYSFGFRPNRSQADAIYKAKEFIQDGHHVCVDMDLSKFFDRVNHDRLMSRLAIRIKDKRVLKLIRAFLESGVMVGGVVSPSEEGTPQGGPLSPLLSNIVLDELDKELEKRNLHFVRYADDFVIYVRSVKAGERVMKSIKHFITTKLRLMVNESKSAVGDPWSSKFLGFCFLNCQGIIKVRLHYKSISDFKDRIRKLTHRSGGKSLKQVIDDVMLFVQGWWGYYRITESAYYISDLGGWIRRRLRSLLWKQWKTKRKRIAELTKRGIISSKAIPLGCSRKGPWVMSRTSWVQYALPNRYFKSLGLVFPWDSHA